MNIDTWWCLKCSSFGCELKYSHPLFKEGRITGQTAQSRIGKWTGCDCEEPELPNEAV